MSDKLSGERIIYPDPQDSLGFYREIARRLEDDDFSADERALAILMFGSYVVQPDGRITFVRHLAGKIGKIRISVNSNEHPPPHFHVDGPGVDACFTLKSCELLKGTINSKHQAAVKAWYRTARPKVIRLWNDTRPDGCPVGPFSE